MLLTLILLYCVITCSNVNLIPLITSIAVLNASSKYVHKKLTPLAIHLCQGKKKGPGSHTRNGVRTHVCIRTLELKSNALTTRPPWYDWIFQCKGYKSLQYVVEESIIIIAVKIRV